MFKFSTTRFLILLLLLLVVVTVAACAPKFECKDPIGCVNIAPDEPIKVGIMQALSGSLQPSGTQYKRSVELALDARNGQLLGHPVELHAEDSLCSEEGGTTAALKMAADPQIIGTIGTTCSSEARTAAPILSKAGQVMISGSNTSPALTSLGGVKGANWNAGYFRTAHNDVNQGLAAATFAFKELGIKQVATIDDGSTYAQGLSDVFEKEFARLGGKIVFSGTVNKGDTDMKPVLEAVAKSGAEMLFFPIFQPEGDQITIQSKQVPGFEKIKLLSADGLFLGPYIESVGDAGIGTYYIVPETPGEEKYQAFVKAYQDKYGEPLTTNFHAHSYDAANILFNAIESVAVKDNDGTLHIGRQALRDYIYHLSGYDGLAGKLTCDEFGDCGPVRFKVVRLDDPKAGIAVARNNIVYRFVLEK